MRIEDSLAVEWFRRSPLEALVVDYYVSPRTNYRAWKASAFCTSLYQWKLKPDLRFTEEAADRLAAAVREYFPRGAFDGVTCPPAGPHRIKSGWYPAGELAKAVGLRLDLDTVTVFTREGYGLSHATGRGAAGAASRAKRAHFDQLRPDVGLDGMKLLLLDDVLLTGQSLLRLYELLTEAGAEVRCAVLARTVRKSEVSRSFPKQGA
jgi:predicted amidophosphoribosyltransferase